MAEVPLNWREEMMKFTSNDTELVILEHGPKSFQQACRLQALKSRYKKIMGIEDPEPPNCQSSFKEWNDQTKSL